MHPQLDNVEQFRLNEINYIKANFIAEIRERELTSKTLKVNTYSKYIAFDYINFTCFINNKW